MRRIAAASSSAPIKTRSIPGGRVCCIPLHSPGKTARSRRPRTKANPPRCEQREGCRTENVASLVVTELAVDAEARCRDRDPERPVVGLIAGGVARMVGERGAGAVLGETA